MRANILSVWVLTLAFAGVLEPLRSAQARASSANDEVNGSVASFNQKFIGACQKMDQEAASELWADDGADLLPGMAPMVGKAAISQWLRGLTPQLAGAKMLYCTAEWKEIHVQGDLAYEWGVNRQKIEFPPPAKSFESEGKIVLVLKRHGDAPWKIALESWSSNPASQ